MSKIVHDRGLHEFYADDPLKADWETWGRRSNPKTRRGFLTGLAAITSYLGAEIVFSRYMPAGLIPAAYASTTDKFTIVGKNGLTLLNDRPLNAETPPHLLDDHVTPSDRLFIRNNGLPPEVVDVGAWQLQIEGESIVNSKTYTLSDLKTKFKNIDLQLVLECAGNGRSEFIPPATGNQWTLGAVGCPRWNGIRLSDVLQDCGYDGNAVYVAYYGRDTHLSGEAGKVPISRGVPIEKALEPESMIVWGMNDEDLHPMNGHPLRLVMGGWPGSVSGKWIDQILIRDRVHDGPKMGSPSYRVPCTPVAPGAEVADQNMCIIEAMPVKSLITHPQSNIQHPIDKSMAIRGHAWSGETSIKSVHISIDFGETWKSAKVTSPTNRHAWQHWETETHFPKKGYYEVWARAVDTNGRSQPMVLPAWNPKGYLNNACHRIATYAV